MNQTNKVFFYTLVAIFLSCSIEMAGQGTEGYIRYGYRIVWKNCRATGWCKCQSSKQPEPFVGWWYHKPERAV